MDPFLTYPLGLYKALSGLVGGSIIGLIYGWKLALVGIGMSCMSVSTRQLFMFSFSIACIPLVISTGYVRLVRVSSMLY